MILIIAAFISSALWNFFSIWNIDVEPEYSGARIDGDVVTLDFVKKMIDDFKHEKCLHKRYVYQAWCSVLQILFKYRCSESSCWHCSYAYQIVLQIREILRALPSLVDISVPDGNHFTVCGDVHGQVVRWHWYLYHSWTGALFFNWHQIYHFFFFLFSFLIIKKRPMVVETKAYGLCFHF